MSVWLGLAEGLCDFFVSHMRSSETARDAWFVDLSRSLLLGALLTGGMALVMGLTILGIFALASRWWAGRRGLPAAPRPSDMFRLAAMALPTICLTYYTSNIIDVLLILICIFSGAFIVAAAVLPLDRFLGRLTRYVPIFLALLMIGIFWYGDESFIIRRFSWTARYGALLKAGLPLALLAAFWTLLTGRRRRLAIGGSALVSVLWLAALLPPARKPLPDGAHSVILVVVDTLRWDRSAGAASLMPVVGRLAEGGVHYTNAYTALPKTQQSVSSILTGLYPWHNGVRRFKSVLRPNNDTLAERFGRAGYRTAAFVHNPWIDYGMGHEQGFDEFVDYHRLESPFGIHHKLLPVRLVDKLRQRTSRRSFNQLPVVASRLTDAALAWITENQHQPYFLWLQYFDPHWPYNPPETYPGTSPRDRKLAERINGKAKNKILRKMRFEMKKTDIKKKEIEAAIRLYDREVVYTDSEITRLLDNLDKGRHPLVIFMSDHGESLGEHQYYFFHGNFTYDVCLKIPLLFYQPGTLPEGVVVEDQVRAVDIVPTLARLVGIDEGRTDGLPLPGLNLPDGDAHRNRTVPFEGDARSEKKVKRIPIKGIEGKWRGVIKDGKKLIAVPYPEGFRFQLYDLEKDPYETRNLYNGKPASVRPYLDAMVKEGLEMWRGEKEQKTRDKKPGPDDENEKNLSEEEAKQLRALGYIQ
jgi:arylsulfatase A-like enzyme